MEEGFIDKKFSKQTQKFLDQILLVVDRYHKMGYKLSLRQLYYQLVTEKIIPNQQKYYGKLSRVLNDARMCGMVDWDIIEDRTRLPHYKNDFDGARDVLEWAIRWFRLPRHYDQEYYVEVWTEKDALYSVLRPITDYYHLKLVINRGYSSASAMYRAFKRFQEAWEYDDNVFGTHQIPVIIYLGDHDPSGLDMDRDIKDRMDKFGMVMKVERLALTKEQIIEHNLPPDPAKTTDPRIMGYVEKHGDGSWEVDALSPPTIDRIVRDKIEEYIDMDLYNKWIPREDETKNKIQKFADKCGYFDYNVLLDEED